MLTDETTAKLRDLAGIEEGVLTEEALFEAADGVDAILESYGFEVEAEDLESYLEGVQEVLDTYQLSEEDEAALQEFLGTLARGVARGVGKVVGGVGSAVGKVTGTYKRARNAVQGAVDTVKQGVRSVKQAYRSGVHAASGAKGPQTFANARKAGERSVMNKPKKPAATAPAPVAAKPVAPAQPKQNRIQQIANKKMKDLKKAQQRAQSQQGAAAKAQPSAAKPGMKPDMAMGKTKVTHGAEALKQPKKKFSPSDKTVVSRA